MDFNSFLPKDSAEVAAWAQAFFSVAAIVAAIKIAKQQAEENRLFQLLTNARRYAELYGPAIAVAEALIDSLHGSLGTLRNELAKGSWGLPEDFYKEQRDLLEVLGNIPVHSLPTVQSAKSVLRLRRLAKDAVNRLQKVGEIIDNIGSVKTTDMSNVDEVIAEIVTELDLMRSDLVRVTRP